MQCSRSSNFLSDLEDKSIFPLFSTISSLTLASDNRASNTLNFLCDDGIGTFLQCLSGLGKGLIIEMDFSY